ncbi:lysosomal acid lipase/cholesteryl ester hydrolase-like [Tropilaelaps mercedesae]|uniref:Lysosomal acid lipase/cholesteryl ester hydrolase-like n=1 Tax=Tropilaelaps mercedesae TaxID=418985 RepID=A0A1V9XTC7_9ACAR|nr:lysosomal acid lipase/cholesteryl ester hydrolase-like [Tropilaelaps mercedesae]
MDLSAQIDYALKVTGREQVYYAGMSQGGASMYALLAKRPDYNRKIRAMAALGTFRRVCHINIWWLNYASTLENYIGRLSIVEVLPKISMLDRACDMADKLCVWFTKTFMYTDIKYLNTTRFPVYMNHFPSGTSKMNLFYYSQLMQESQCTSHWSEVREYDYDRAPASRWSHARSKTNVHRALQILATSVASDDTASRKPTAARLLWGVFGDAKKINPDMYEGRLEPPILDPENINVPIKLYWSEGDRYAPPAEQALLKRELRSIVAEFHITDPAWGHYSFAVSPYNASLFTDVADFFDDCSLGSEYCTLQS